MLPCHHGASTLVKTLWPPIIATMNTFKETSTSTADTMRSAFSRLSGGRALSSTARPNPSLAQHNTWHPNHGIVFGSRPMSGTTRQLNTTATLEKMQDFPQVTGEESYILSSAYTGTTKLGYQASENPNAPTTTESAEPASNSNVESELVPHDPAQNELPQTSTSFKMTEELFRAAKNAEPGSPGSYWTYSLYRQLLENGTSKKPTIHYCISKHTTERVLQSYFMDQKVLGFDIEWTAPQFPRSYMYAGPKRNVSLIQIASEDRIILIHIAMFAKNDIQDLVAPSLKMIMEDPGVTKVGVAIKADCTRLRKHLDIDAQGLFELSHLYKLVKFSENKEFKSINKKLVSLATQVQDHLHLPLYKGEVRCSDWGQKLLLDQIMYAASDTYASLQLYYTLDIKRKGLDPTPPLPHHAELNMPIRLAEGVEIPTDTEAEDVEPEDTKPVKRKYTRSAQKEIVIVPDNIEIEEEVDPEASPTRS